MKAADEAEFGDFVRAAWPTLRQAAYALTGDTDDAEDLLQGVLVGVYARWPKVRRDNPVAYVRRALVNAYIDTWRRRRRLEIEPTGDVPEQMASDDSTAIDDRGDLSRRLRMLSPRERTMVVLRYYLDHSEAEVAHTMGCSVGTVKSTCSRALQRLRILAPLGEEAR